MLPLPLIIAAGGALMLASRAKRRAAARAAAWRRPPSAVEIFEGMGEQVTQEELSLLVQAEEDLRARGVWTNAIGAAMRLQLEGLAAWIDYALAWPAWLVDYLPPDWTTRVLSPEHQEALIHYGEWIRLKGGIYADTVDLAAAFEAAESGALAAYLEAERAERWEREKDLHRADRDEMLESIPVAGGVLVEAVHVGDAVADFFGF